MPTKATAVDSGRSGLRGNIIKGISSKLSANSSVGNNDNNNNNAPSTATQYALEQRVSELETKISEKQNALETGNGINIEHNTIGLTQEFANLPNQVNETNQAIENLSQQISDATLPSNYYNIDETKAYLQEKYYDKHDIDQSLSNANFMNYFDDDVSANAAYVFKTDGEGNGTWQELKVQNDWDPEF